MSSPLVLYSYWRSSAAFRVRIALNLKGLAYELRTVNLVAGEGEQHRAEYRRLNPQGLVPTLLDGERVFRQSLAIIEYLDEAYDGETKLLPPVARDRARVRASRWASPATCIRWATSAC
ncbi:maleylacetoacetate isomerase/glutathione S-transferase [mine drainage metagenome]|uniref:Maleylacetoacetate isomerase/glutathione S-transferase n=1 Tax=mine drainage metagenome TaxID=410659 RepID=T0ZHI9_9ZZZZ